MNKTWCSTGAEEEVSDLASKLVDGISRMCISAAHLRRSAREVRAGVCASENFLMYSSCYPKL